MSCDWFLEVSVLPAVFSSMLHVPSQWLFAYSIMLFAPSVTDLSRRQIPNGLTFTICLFALSFGAHCDGAAGLQHALGGFAIAAGLFLALYAIGGVGGGDVKLAAGFGALVGPHLAPYFIVSACAYLGVWSLLDIFRRRHWTFIVRLPRALEIARTERRTLPVAPALALGAISADTLATLLH